MKKKFLVLILFIISVFFSYSGISNANPYCAVPPFAKVDVPSNIMLVLDYSGSMSWWAYPERNYYIYYDDKTYYGYFKPSSMYKCSYWSRSRCSGYWYKDSDGYFTGNYLNWLYMARIDILRWILTGGRVVDCGSTECVEGYNGEKIYYKDASSYDNETGKIEGILQKIGAQENKPRIGLSIFGYSYSGGVFERVGLSYDYNNVINTINSTNPNGNTCTQCAVEEMKKLFSQDAATVSEYGNVNPYVFDNTTVPCAKSFILLMSDGEWNKGINTPLYEYCYSSSCDPIDQIDSMWKGGKADLDNSTSNYLPGNQMVETYTVSMFASPTDSGTNALKWMAVYGNYNDLNSNGYPCNQSSYPITSLTVDENLENLSTCNEVKKNSNDTGPYGFFEGDDPQTLKNAITEAFNEILKQASSGTAASVLSEKERVNMGILQAAFYPQKSFVAGTSSYTVNWIGSLYNWWLYSSYSLNGFVSNIREDTIENKDLDVCSNGQPGGDYIINYVFDNNKLKIEGYKSTCSGEKYSSVPSIIYDGLGSAHYVWEAGEKLSETSPDNRIIYTYTGDLQPTVEENLEQLKNLENTVDRKISKLFGDDDGNGEIDDSGELYTYAKEISFSDLKSYIYGTDIAGYRSRDIGNGYTWKLGDIIYSTPKVVNYTDYSVAFVGANDGMLHAFLVGKYRYDNLGPYQLTKLRNNSFSSSSDELGKELWAFIPKNVLPYLRFLADPNYCHMYFVDLTPYIIEIKDRWGNVEKRILIGGMRLGGAVGSDNTTVSVNPPKDTCPNPLNYNPANDPSTSTPGCLGLSSYFALDITDPTQPKFLWEFTSPNLGFSYSGPAFVKEWDSSSNSWKYYIIFASGPTDYKGDVGQHLYLFVLSLNNNFTINRTYKIDVSSLLNLGYAFGGRLFTTGISYKELENILSNDPLFESTDLVFFGISEESSNEWEGNVIGIKMIDIINGKPEPILDPSQWHIFKMFSDPIGPVVAPISFEKCFKNNFIYFGSGRYFFRDDTPDGDNESLYGLNINKCVDSSCTFDKNSLYTSSYFSTSSPNCSVIGNSDYGWYQDLLGEVDGYNKERTITGATTTDQNVIYFTTMQPTSDICGHGGRSRLWGLNCATGESLTNQNCSEYTTGNVVGTLLLQTSIGEISKFDININPNNPSSSITPFTEEKGKATEWKTGTAPPNRSNYIPPPPKKPAQIMYEVEH